MDWHRENISNKKNCIKLGIRNNKKKKTGVGMVRRRKIQEQITEGESQNLKLSRNNCEE